MIRYVQGNIFESSAQTIVNPVNCKGVMGAGLAKQFKERYPKMYQAYHIFCMTGLFKPGKLMLHKESVINLCDQDGNVWPAIVCDY